MQAWGYHNKVMASPITPVAKVCVKPNSLTLLASARVNTGDVEATTPPVGLDTSKASGALEGVQNGLDVPAIAAVDGMKSRSPSHPEEGCIAKVSIHKTSIDIHFICKIFLRSCFVHPTTPGQAIYWASMIQAIVQSRCSVGLTRHQMFDAREHHKWGEREYASKGLVRRVSPQACLSLIRKGRGTSTEKRVLAVGTRFFYRYGMGINTSTESTRVQKCHLFLTPLGSSGSV